MESDNPEEREVSKTHDLIGWASLFLAFFGAESFFRNYPMLRIGSESLHVPFAAYLGGVLLVFGFACGGLGWRATTARVALVGYVLIVLFGYFLMTAAK